MANKNIVNEINDSDFELIMKACSRTGVERDKGLVILNKYFGGNMPLVDINKPIPNQGDWTPLSFSTFFGRVEESNLLIKLGADIKHTMSEDLTLLHISSNEGNDKLCSIYLENGIYVDVVTKKGFTPMMGACTGGHENVVETLMEYKPNIFIKDFKGNTCLDYGVASGNLSIVARIRHDQLKATLDNGSDTVVKRVVKL